MPHITNYDHCLHFQVLDKVISFVDGSSPEVVADNRGNICISIEFDEQWDGVGKTARFIYNGQWKDVPLNTDDECICPSEVVKKGRFSLGVYGAELKTTTPIIVNVQASILSDCEGELPEDPTPGEYQQIMNLYTATCEAADEATRLCAEAVEAVEAASKLLIDTKEELESGGFITAIQERNHGNKLSFWVGTKEEYEALPEPPQNCYVIIVNDSTVSDIKLQISMLTKNLSDAINNIQRHEEEIRVHANDKSNPHSVTLEQIGAAPDGYGLGNSVSKNWDDVDNLNTTGWYRFNKENDGIVIDENHSVTYAFMQVSSFNDSHVVQTLYPLIAIDKTYNPVLIRHCRGRVWEDWKWVTPLNKHNVEYLTTEYFNGKPVYTMLYTFTPASSKVASSGLSNTCTVIRSYIRDKFFSIPYKVSNREVNAFVEINGGGTRYSETGNNVDGNVVYTQIWYTKD